MESFLSHTARQFKALGDENRLHILELLREENGAPPCCWKISICPSPPFPTI